MISVFRNSTPIRTSLNLAILEVRIHAILFALMAVSYQFYVPIMWNVLHCLANAVSEVRVLHDKTF